MNEHSRYVNYNETGECDTRKISTTNLKYTAIINQAHLYCVFKANMCAERTDISILNDDTRVLQSSIVINVESTK